MSGFERKMGVVLREHGWLLERDGGL